MPDTGQMDRILDAVGKLRDDVQGASLVADSARAASVEVQSRVKDLCGQLGFIRSEMHWLRGRLQTSVWNDEPPKLNGVTGLRVLFSDDDTMFLRAVTRLFGPTGITLFLASSIANALGIIDDNKIDVAILDLQFKDGSGLEIANKLKERSPCTTIAFLTGGAASEEFEQHAASLGATVLLKPEVGDRVMAIFKEAKRKIEAKSG